MTHDKLVPIDQLAEEAILGEPGKAQVRKEYLHRYRIVREPNPVRLNEPYPLQAPRMTNSRAVFRAFKDYCQSLDHEQFIIMPLDTRLKPMGWFIASQGTINSCLATPHNVFRPALLCNAAAIVMIHNHPSGESDPSSNDDIITARLVAAGSMLGIRVLEHVIIGDDYFSYADHGLISQDY